MIEPYSWVLLQSLFENFHTYTNISARTSLYCLQLIVFVDRGKYLLVQVVNEASDGGQLDDHHHGLRQDDAVEPDQVLVIQGVHAVVGKISHKLW